MHLRDSAFHIWAGTLISEWEYGVEFWHDGTRLHYQMSMRPQHMVPLQDFSGPYV